MKRLVLFASVSLVLSSAARAGDINDGERAVSAHELAPILRSAGLIPISPPLREGSVFYVQAMDDGDNVRVTIDARTGRIIAVRPEGMRRNSASRYDRFGVYTPLPPRGIPSAPGARRPAPPPDNATGSRDLDDDVSTGSVTNAPPSSLPPPPSSQRSATGATPPSSPNVAPRTGPVPPKPAAARPTASKAEASRRITAPDGPKPVEAEAVKQTPAPTAKPQDAKPGAIPPMMSHEL